MKELQSYAKQFQKEMNWEINEENYQLTKSSLLNNYMLLTTEVSEVAEELRKAFNQTHALVNQGMEEDEAFKIAKKDIKEDIGKEMADCLAYICKIANYFDIDLEESFYTKMDEVSKRKNKDIIVNNER
ncbi:MazG nucleotide pyrophosphohydrolase domain-containing protein [Robertmurraya korlensis]|uniref:MazG nucleotide pyrophosphohydrolase domain-containing protein n=1 Tax=Robertmurraya korlensis TaxID=519977 RepID=UPI000825E305|nr:MazG nucleotide pyrophosphohydrolase domain-containing protein [Robertmurraya korlensis]